MPKVKDPGGRGESTMHKARARILVEPVEGTAMESSEEGGAAEALDAAVQKSVNEPVKLRSVTVTVLEPSKGRVKEGRIRLFSSGRTRSSSTRSNSGSRGWWGKDVWVVAELYLAPTALCYRIEGTGVCEFLLEDIIGIQVNQVPPPSNSIACEIFLHLYPVISAPQARTKVRKQCVASILFDSGATLAENMATASELKTAVLLQTQRVMADTFGVADMERDRREGSTEVSEKESVLVARKFLVFINPKAGSQQGESLFKTIVEPMLKRAEICYNVEITKRQNHAREMIKTYDLDKIDGIVISSGDGLLYEVINGIMERSDWERAIKIPIGMLPTGSGNALCASALFESNESYGVEDAAFQIIRGGVVPLDLATVQLGDGTSTYMSLLAGFGIVADIDIESEKFRKLGKTRFLLGALSSIMKKKIYSAKLSYLPAEGAGKEPEQVPIETQDPNALGVETTSKSSSEGSEEAKENSSGESPPMRHATQPALTTRPGESGPPSNLPPTDLLVPLDQTLPDTWVTKEDRFLCINPMMVAYMSSDFFGDREIVMGTGNIRLMWVDGNITRKCVYNVMTSAGTGKHTEMDEVYRVDVKAFRLEPLSPPGLMTVDGEVVHYGTMQAQVHPQMARVMSRRRKT